MLGFYPVNIDLYKQALMHKSASIKGENGKLMNNERLEFLGDAILDAIVADIVYKHFHGKREGFLTNARSKIVQRESLNRLAHEIGLDRLILSNGKQVSHNSYMGGNAFEALVGAVYLDRGYDYCMRFMERRILKSLINIDKVAYKEVNFKSKLLEWSQKNRIRLDFQLLNEQTENQSNIVFRTEVLVEGIVCGRGNGYSKKESQQKASQDALMQLRRDKKLEARVFAAKSKRTAMEETPQMQVPEVPEANQGNKKSEAPKKKSEAQKPAPQNTMKEKASEEPQPKATEPQKPKATEPRKTAAAKEKPAKKQEKPAQEKPKATEGKERPSAEAKPRNAEAGTEPSEAEPKGNARKQRDRARKSRDNAQKAGGNAQPQARGVQKSTEPSVIDGTEIDFDDIRFRRLTRDEIIAQAEKEAFEQAEGA